MAKIRIWIYSNTQINNKLGYKYIPIFVIPLYILEYLNRLNRDRQCFYQVLYTVDIMDMQDMGDMVHMLQGDPY